MNQENQVTVPYALLEASIKSANYAELLSATQTHSPALKFVCDIIRYTRDENLITSLVHSALPENYDRDTLAEVPDMIKWAIENAEPVLSSGSQNEKASSLLVGIVKSAGCELFHDSMNVPYITFREEGRGPLTYNIKSERAELLLNRLYFKKTEKAINAQGMSEAVANLTQIALHDGEKKEVYQRLAWHEGRVIYNLANNLGQVVIINETGYTISDHSPVAFLTSEFTGPQLSPAEGEGRQFAHVLQLSEQSELRSVAFLLSALNPSGPYFGKIVEGEQGSGKSFFSEFLKQVVDPGPLPSVSMPQSERDLMILASCNHVTTFDNVSGVKGDMSDVLCRLATGGAYVSRQLYTDRELAVTRACRPFILNGIYNIGHRADLLDRCITTKLDVMPIEKRKEERQLKERLEKAIPGTLHMLFKMVSAAIANLDKVPLPSGMRMADAARWISAAEKGGPYAEGSLIQAIRDSRADVIAERVTVDPLAYALVKHLKKGRFYGTFGRLFQEVCAGTQDKNMPKSPSHLSGLLKRMRPNYQEVGIVIEFAGHKKKGSFVEAWLDVGGKFNAEMFESLETGRIDC